MAENVTFNDPSGDGKPVELETIDDPHRPSPTTPPGGAHPRARPPYVDLGMLYRFAQLEHVRRQDSTTAPLHVAVARAHGDREGPRHGAVRRPASASPITGSR